MGILAANLVRDYPDLNFGLHAHNDRGLALQNGLVSIYNGFNMIEGAVAGFGNRSGLPLLETLDLICREKNIEIKDGSLAAEKLVEAARLADEVFMKVPEIYRPVSGMLVEKENLGVLNIPDYLGVEREADYFLNKVGLHRNTIVKTLSSSGFDADYVNDQEFIETVRVKIQERMSQIYELKRSEYPILSSHIRIFYENGVMTTSDIVEEAEKCAATYSVA
jgi:2-isopropylmalate synthase